MNVKRLMWGKLNISYLYKRISDHLNTPKNNILRASALEKTILKTIILKTQANENYNHKRYQKCYL